MASTTPTTIAANDPRLANFANAFGGTSNSTFTDFLKIVNASPTYVQQLNNYLNDNSKGTIFTTSTVNPVGANGPMAASAETDPTNGQITVATSSPQNDLASSAGYKLAVTIAHELGHSNDANILTDGVVSEAKAEINAYQLMGEAVNNLIASGNTTSTASTGGALFLGSSANGGQPIVPLSSFQDAQNTIRYFSSSAQTGDLSSTCGTNAACVAAVARVLNENEYKGYYSNSSSTAPQLLSQNGNYQLFTDLSNPDNINVVNSQTGQVVQTIAVAATEGGALAYTVKDLTNSSSWGVATNNSGQLTQTDTATVNAGATADDLKNFSASGAVQNEIQTNTTAAGQVSATISGTGATDTASNATITLAAGSQATLAGSGNTVTGNAGATLALAGSSNNDIVTMGSNGAISVADGDHGEVINQTGGTVTLGNSTNTTIVGSNVQIGGGTGNTVSVVGNDTVSGTNDYVYLASNVNVTVNGTGMAVNTSANDVITGSGALVRVGGNGGGNTINTTVVGNNDAIDDLGTKNTLSVVGTNQTIQNDAAGTSIYLGSSTSVTDKGSSNIVNTATGDAITATGDTVRVGGNGGGNTAVTTVLGGNDIINNLGTNNTLAVVGNNQTIQNDAAGTAIYLGAGTSVTDQGTNNIVNTAASDAITATGDTVYVGGNGGGNTAVTTVFGGSDIVDDRGTNGTLAVVGANQTVQNDAAGTAIYLGASTSVTDRGTNDFINTAASDAITATGDTVYVGANGGGNTAVTTVIGGNDTVDNRGTTGTLAVVGYNQTVQNDAAGTAIYLGANTSVTDRGTNNFINTAASDAITATGDTVYVGANGGGNTAVTTVQGGSDTVDDRGTNGTLAVVGANQTVQNDAAGTAIYLGASTSVTDKGTNDVINTAASDAITATGDTVYVGANGGGNTAVTTVQGGNDIIDDRGTNNTLAVVGTNQIVQNDAQGAIYLGSNTSITDKGTGDSINTAAGDNIVASGDTIRVGNNLAAGQSAGNIAIQGNDTVYDGASGTVLSLIGNDTVYANNDNIYLAANENVTINGTDSIHGQAGDIVRENLTSGYIIDNWSSSGVESSADYTASGAEVGTSSDPTQAETYIDTPVATTPPPEPPPVDPTPPTEDPCPDGIDPIILNLRGDKVNTTSVSGSPAYFDM